jgi:hypothetical protein
MAKIFLSSTATDLGEYRKVVADTLAQAGHEVVKMEDFYDLQGTPQQIDERRVKSCDVFVGIVAYWYGDRPQTQNPHRLSFTELEFEVAKRKGLPSIFFQPSSGIPWRPEFVARRAEDTDQLERFRERVRAGGLLKTFENPYDLARQVLLAMIQFEQSHAARKEIGLSGITALLDRIVGDPERFIEFVSRFRGNGPKELKGQSIAEFVKVAADRLELRNVIDAARVEDPADPAIKAAASKLADPTRFLEDRSCDVFVSFSEDEADGRWGSKLADDLQETLIRRMNVPVHVATSLLGGEPGEECKAGRAGCLVAVLSPQYAASRRCMDELGQYESSDPEIDRAKVVFPSGSFPGYLPSRFTRHRPTRFPGDTDTESAAVAYRLALADLATEIEEDLRRLKCGDCEDRKIAAYLADVPPSLQQERLVFVRMLRERGFSVMPKLRPPKDPAAFERTVIKDLEGCSVFVQLLNEDPGDDPYLPPGWVGTLADLGVGFAKGRSRNKGLQEQVETSFAWVRSGFDRAAAPDNLQKLLDSTTVKEVGFPEFQGIVSRAIDRLTAPKAQVPDSVAPKGGEYYVFIASEERDEQDLDRLAEALSELDVLRQEGDGELVEDYLSACQAVVIAYRSADRAKVMRRAFGYHRRFKEESRIVPIVVRLFEPPQKQPLGLRLKRVEEMGRDVEDQELSGRIVELIRSGGPD